MRMTGVRLLAITILGTAGCSREPDRQTLENEQVRAFAMSCAETLNARDPLADAKAAIRAGDSRLLSGWQGGWTDVHAPDVPDCDPIFEHTSPRGLPKLPLGYGRKTDYFGPTDELWEPCWSANRIYAGAFNRQMLRLDPAALENSCRPKTAPIGDEGSGTLKPLRDLSTLGNEGPLKAIPRHDLSALVTDDDYPASALRNEESGTTKVSLSITMNGRVADCQVTRPSGSSALDQATCRFLRARARFDPARDARGAPVEARYDHSQRWRLPAD
jgi:TonB family protein